MYHLPNFKASDQEEVFAFMKAHPFITLCGVGANGHPVATHIPVLMEERNGQFFLLAHIMRKQEHTVAFENNHKVLAIFSGAHAYVSASWYDKKNVASTWNYHAVHASGTIKFLDEKELYHFLVKLTDFFEGHSHSPAAVKNMDEKYVADNMKAIVAFKIEVTDIQHLFKLSQNRDESSYNKVIDHLQQSGDADACHIASLMNNRKQTLPNKE